MCKIALTLAAIFAVICSLSLTSAAMADEGPIIRHSKKIHHICVGRHCGPYTPCGVRCRVVCPDPVFLLPPLWGLRALRWDPILGSLHL
jgi:hypothetical protein